MTTFSLQDLPDECLVRIAQDWLNPRDQRRLAATCRRWHYQSLLPQPLRINICALRNTTGTTDECCRLDGSFFVSSLAVGERERETTLPHRRNSLGPPLTAVEYLKYKTPYYFWKYDYEEECPVFLGKQLRQSFAGRQNHGRGGRGQGPPVPCYRYTLGFRPEIPNQHWRIDESDGSKTERRRNANVRPKDSIRIVAVDDCLPDNAEQRHEYDLKAEAKPIHLARSGWEWYVSLKESNAKDENSQDDERQRQRDFSFTYTNLYLGSVRREKPRRFNTECFLLYHPPKTCSESNNPRSKPRLFRARRASRKAVAQRISNDDFGSHLEPSHYPLATYCIPDINDSGAYMIFSPESWKPEWAPSTLLIQDVNTTLLSIDGRSKLIEFSLWNIDGQCYFQACSLDFAISIPWLDSDRAYIDTMSNFSETCDSSVAAAIRVLLESNSARWLTIRKYFAAAAQVGEGYHLDMDAFVNRLTDHQDHQVHQVSSELLVLTTKHGRIDTTLVQDIPRNGSNRWKFFFSW